MRNFRVRENELFQKIEYTKRSLQEIFAKKAFEERENFNSDELALIAGTRQKLDDLRIELAKIRIDMHQNIEKINLIIKFVNIYAVPLLILLILAIVGGRKLLTHRIGGYKIIFNREFKWAAVIALLLFVGGGLSFYLSAQKGIEEYENKPVLAELVHQLNEIQKITLTSASGVLNFYKQDGVWKLENEPCLPVYQERVESFLTALSDMVYYEKKSDKAEYLSKFGLEPSAAKDSTSVEVKLFGPNNKILTDLVIGKYDIDIGRGGRAAYMRFADKFQVWMVKADLIDMSVKAQDWTYSSLWNLRFGRLSGFNKNTNLNRTMELVKYMLNTSLKNPIKQKPESEKVLALDLAVEGNQKIGIDFWQDKEHTYVNYVFDKKTMSKHTEFFAKAAEKCYYEIDNNDFEKIKNVTNTIQ